MIESINNERIKFYAKLKDKKYRDLNKLFIIEGKHLVEEALKKEVVKEILLLNGEENIYGEVTYVTLDILKKITDLISPPKVLAICHRLNNEEVKGNILVLDEIKDPGNLGTMIRSAVAFNYETVILSENTVDLYNSKVIRASEGMIFNLNFIRDELSLVIPKLKVEGYLIYGTDVINGIDPSNLNKDLKHALIIGSETAGIRNEIKKLCDQNLYIKTSNKCESLNAAISASILMYELNKKN